jgi:hypothetical protein
MTKTLSNIELYHHSKTVSTVPDDSLIVETVDAEILEHADVLYKNYKALGWRPYSYRCKHCDLNVTRSLEKFIKHLETCKGLDD